MINAITSSARVSALVQEIETGQIDGNRFSEQLRTMEPDEQRNAVVALLSAYRASWDAAEVAHQRVRETVSGRTRDRSAGRNPGISAAVKRILERTVAENDLHDEISALSLQELRQLGRNLLKQGNDPSFYDSTELAQFVRGEIWQRRHCTRTQP